MILKKHNNDMQQLAGITQPDKPSAERGTLLYHVDSDHIFTTDYSSYGYTKTTSTRGYYKAANTYTKTATYDGYLVITWSLLNPTSNTLGGACWVFINDFLIDGCTSWSTGTGGDVVSYFIEVPFKNGDIISIDFDEKSDSYVMYTEYEE